MNADIEVLAEARRNTCLTLIRLGTGAASAGEFLLKAACRLRSRDLPIDRIFASVRMLHPAFRARTYLWEAPADTVHTTEWPHGLTNRPGYYESPDYHVHTTGLELRVRNLQDPGQHRCELYGKLRASGYTDYLIVPLRFNDGTINTLSIATKASQGFRGRDLEWFRESAPLFTVILERHATSEALDAVLDAYLGHSVGQQILRGRIRAGDGQLIEAAILMADLRDFTQHAAHLEPAATVRLLNDYFDCLVDPISEHGGHVLKFIGDAVLAFFPILPGSAAPAPLNAVHAIGRRLAALNGVRMGASRTALQHALCVHYGRVLYGNIGSSNRLDFTIIGEAVNLTARGVEAAKGLGVDYLFTGAYVERFGAAGLMSLGRRMLRGVPEPVDMFTLAANGGA